ncbi:MAG: hypothetical protein KDK36_17550 [Leptospiraceae bacterium]|nr:hypothetical protein [Leptospiraceae bacterium]
MKEKEKFDRYIKEGIDLYNKCDYGKSIDKFSAANYIDQNQTPYYWMAKARYEEGDIWRALYNFYLGLCHYKEINGQISREEIHQAISEIEPQLEEKAPQYISIWEQLKKDHRFYSKNTSISFQIDSFGFPEEIKKQTEQFSLDKLNSFVKKYIEKMIAKFGIINVQSAIDLDSDPNNPVINYITCLMELGILHELFHQSFASNSLDILKSRMEYLAWAINITVANNLIENGVRNIPKLENEICIYYSWNNLKIIIQRIMPIAIQIDGAVPHEVRGFIHNLIAEKLD